MAATKAETRALARVRVIHSLTVVFPPLLLNPHKNSNFNIYQTKSAFRNPKSAIKKVPSHFLFGLGPFEQNLIDRSTPTEPKSRC